MKRAFGLTALGTVACFASFLVTACGQADDESAIRETLAASEAAYNSSNYDAHVKTLCAYDAEHMPGERADFHPDEKGNVHYEASAFTFDGDVAAVTLVTSYANGETTESSGIPFKKENGRWLWCWEMAVYERVRAIS